MNNKLNYLLAPFVIISLIGNTVVYFKLNKQISDTKKELTAQKEKAENLQNLVTFNWKKYQDDKFGFGFKYPDYATICDDTVNLENFEKTDLNLRIRLYGDPCDEKDVAPALVIIKKNAENYKTAEEAFNKELLKDYTTPDLSYAKELQEAYESVIKTNFTYFKIGGLDAYGGEIISTKPSSDPRITSSLGYRAIILKNDYLIKFDGGYEQIFEGRKIGDKPVFDTMVSSFYFNSSGLLK